MTATVFELPDESLSLYDIAEAAKARGMHLITRRDRILVSPIVPAGWSKYRCTTRQSPERPMP